MQQGRGIIMKGKCPENTRTYNYKKGMSGEDIHIRRIEIKMRENTLQEQARKKAGRMRTDGKVGKVENRSSDKKTAQHNIHLNKKRKKKKSNNGVSVMCGNETS